MIHLEGIHDLPVNLIMPSPHQPRQFFDSEKLQLLADNIEQNGLIHPILCRPLNEHYELVCGERRWRAVKRTDLLTIRSEVRVLTDLEARRLTLAENVHRDDLTPIDEIRAIAEWVDSCLADNEDYLLKDDDPVKRVRWVLGKLDSDLVQEKTERFFNRFIEKIEDAFSALTRDITWRSYLRNDLLLIIKTSEDVQKVATEKKLNKSQIKALQAVKEEAPSVFEQIKETGKVEVDIGLFETEEVSIEEASSREIKKASTRKKLLVGQDTVKGEIDLSFLPEHNILIGDFRELGKDLPDNSIDLIFTDPPYHREVLPLYGELAELGARVLKPGGSLLCYVGHYALPEIFNLMTPYLRYWWINCCLHAGERARLPGKWVFVSWKPILWFVKDGRGCNTYVDDRGASDSILAEIHLIESQPDKEHHKWGQGVIDAKYYIERLTKSGEVVLDPFCGGGTTCVAAKELGRDWIAFEKDRNTAIIARRRLGECQTLNSL